MARKKVLKTHPIVETFARRLREERRRKGLSQMDLAFKANINIGYVGKLERYEAAPGLDMIGRIADALGVPAGNLVDTNHQALASLSVLRDQIQRKMGRLLKRDDEHALEAVSILIGLVDNALARKNKQ